MARAQKETNEKMVGQNKRRTLRQSGTARAWLVVVTNKAKEGLVIPQLFKREMEVYRPMAHKTVTHARETKIKAVPLYPSHLFVRGQDDDKGYAHISGMLGVAWIYPYMLMDTCIERHRREEQDGFIEICKSLDPELGAIAPGDKAKTLDGMLEIVVAEAIDENRVAALSTFMGGNSRLVVDISKLAK